jgi:uncharacterized protein
VRIVPTALAFLALAACQQAADPRGVQEDETLLTVVATGRAETRPDEARLQLGVQSVAESAGEASSFNRQKMGRVTSALARLGVKPDDLQTRNLNLQRIQDGRDRGQFRAVNVVEVKLRDMKRVGQAVAVATEAGANVLWGPELRVSDQEGSTRFAYAAAYKAARARADVYAGAAGLKVKRVLAIHDGGERGSPPPYARDAGMAVEQSAGVGNAAPFSAGINSSEVRVRVDFALGD